MMKFNPVIFYGFSIFAMFFGSGNLVFPIEIGVVSKGAWLYGFLGLFFTAVLLPLLGLFVIKLYKGNYEEFFAQAGKFTKIILPLFTLSLLGPLGVVPRCITVSHGSFAYIFPQTKLSVFSAIFCSICLCFAVNTNFMLKILGKVLSPVLFIFLITLIIWGFNIQSQNFDPSVNSLASFKNGFFTGYETMDLFAAFFFSSLIFKQIAKNYRGDNNIQIVAIKASLIGGTLLCLIYFGFVYLGASFSEHLENTQAQLLLPSLANQIIGKNASIFICITVTLSCLTTAVALSNIYANYISNKLGYVKNNCLITFLVILIAYFVSLFDFNSITNFLSPLLEISYPSLIALTIISIITKRLQALKIFVFYFITFIMIINKTYIA